jgi:pyridoxamine 5'-phosphate oxidase
MSLDQMRKSYQLSGLHEREVHTDPIAQFQQWFDQANAAEVPNWLEINAMTLSTAAADGRITSRIVLLKGIDAGRFMFFSNYRSTKAKQMEINPSVALCILWPHLERQVRICGHAEKTSREVSIEYFHSRPRGSQLGALVSSQSSTIQDRSLLEQSLRHVESLYEGQEIPCPEHWGGYAVTPDEIEFWQGRDNRLHDRIVYHRHPSHWSIARLAP